MRPLSCQNPCQPCALLVEAQFDLGQQAYVAQLPDIGAGFTCGAGGGIGVLRQHFCTCWDGDPQAAIHKNAHLREICFFLALEGLGTHGDDAVLIGLHGEHIQQFQRLARFAAAFNFQLITGFIDLEVLFETDKAIVRPEYYSKITELAEFTKKYPNTVVTIEGHTDNRGKEDYNQALSQRRANAVKEVLITQFGVATERLNSVGYGESQPRASNDTVEGRQLNRRVVAVVEERARN